MNKSLQILSIILDVICEIALIPFHIIKAISDVVETLNK